MEEKQIFHSELIYDLAKHKEFARLNTLSSTRNLILFSVIIACNLYLLLGLDNLFTARLLLMLSIFYGIMSLARWFRSRKGGIEYKRILRSNNGEIPHHTITVDENGIQILSSHSGSAITGTFPNVRYIMESQNLLVIVDEVKLAHILDKSTLTGGSRDELVAFLQNHCPKLKTKIRTGKAGRIIGKVLAAVVIAAALISAAVILQIPQKLSGQITNDMSYQQMADKLAQLDIQISPETIRELASYDTENSYPLSFLYDDYPKVMNLLSWEGMGVYDLDTMDWTPSRSGVYWFDIEAMDASAIYTNFLTGIDAMSEELSFTGISEDYSQLDAENGTGKVNLSFVYLEQTYNLSAQYNYDWFDTDILYAVGRILAEDADANDLWMVSDGDLGILLYYGTEEEMTALARKTGLTFFDCVTMRMGH